MFAKLILDSDSSNVTNIADQRKSTKSNHIEHVFGYQTTSRPVEQDHEDIKLTKKVFTPRYFQFAGDYPNRILISGASLSGKSYFASMLIRRYKKQYKDNDVIVFSKLDDDPVLDKYKPTRIELSEDLIEDPIELEELHDSLVIFDDIDSLTNKDVRKAVHNLRDRIFATGRHENIACITTSQILLKGKESQQSLENANLVVLFPIASRGQVHAFLKDKMHFEKEIIQKICKLRTRWVMIHKACPYFVLYETGFFFI